MGRLVFGMMQSLDGYIDVASGSLQFPPPGPILHRHFNDLVRGLDGLLYGRRMYEVMRYWDEDQPAWDEIEHDFAQAWRSKPKWVASRSLTSVGPNATLMRGDLSHFAQTSSPNEMEKSTLPARSLRTCCPLRVSLTSIACTFVRTCSPPVNPTSPVPSLCFA
jgi:dihydrofolate reductase